MILAQIVPAQVAPRQTAPKGPRALGLLQLAPNGKAHLIPITIMYDGQFYDASAYKASPVPMALESGTVYEAVRTGVSQGLFTVTGALQANNTWIGDGTWQSASELAAAAKRKSAPPKQRSEPVEGPPVLRRGGPEKPKSPESAQTAPPGGSNPTSTGSSPAPTTPAPTSGPVASAPAPPVAPSAEEDPNRPVLRRGAPSSAERKQPELSIPAVGKGRPPTTPTSVVPTTKLEMTPAISDSDGPDPRPYSYPLKPEEEKKLREKILAVAADEVRLRAKELARETVAPPARSHTPARVGTSTKLPQPTFEDVQLHAFDLSNSNEPVLVLTTKARMPSRPNTAGADLQYIVTVVARDDMYGELHKAFTSITDTQHSDVLPRLEFIDAVDADGDGRGELLFRHISDAGRAFIVYRVIGDRLWPLFQGTPGQ